MILLFILFLLASFMMWIGSLLLFLALRHWRHMPVVRALGLFIAVVSLAGFGLLVLLIASAVTNSQIAVLRYGMCAICALIGVASGYAAWHLETGGEGKKIEIKEWLSSVWEHVKSLMRKRKQ